MEIEPVCQRDGARQCAQRARFGDPSNSSTVRRRANRSLQPGRPLGTVFATAAWCVTLLVPGVASSQDANPAPMRMEIDLRDLSRQLIQAEITIPIPQSDEAERTVALWYPKWVPGSHGPGGPIANIAGLTIKDSAGALLPWSRTPGEVFRLEATVPGDSERLHISLRYIADQPTTTSFGHDCFSGSNLGVVSPGALLWYPESADIDRQQIAARLHLPPGWQAATALRPVNDRTDNGVGEATDEGHILAYQATSLRTFVDSPIMCGQHYQAFDLVEENRRDTIPPHTLHVFTDDARNARLNDKVVDGYRAMVTQTAWLIGSHPFDRFDILLAITDELPKNGLEHSRSTFNVLPPAVMKSPATLKGWDRLLVPHEYLHAWCGKYRRPAGMLTRDFHSPKDTELLWVYEGLTQYLGELVEARSGLMSPDEFRHRLAVELRRAMHQQGRQWRTLADTGAASHILRAGSPNWGGLRRSQDYYMEGMLFWLEADALIRRHSGAQKSLDDFCASFLGSKPGSAAPAPFTRRDVVRSLRAVADLDWDGLIQRRIESYQEQFDPSVARLLGYDFRLQREAPAIPSATFRHQSGIDALDSLGIAFNTSGDVQHLLLGSPADRARMSPRMKALGVNGRTWSGPRLVEALTHSQNGRPLSLLVAEGDELRTIQLHYHDGPRYWNLRRQPGQPDLLDEILKPHS